SSPWSARFLRARGWRRSAPPRASYQRAYCRRCVNQGGCRFPPPARAPGAGTNPPAAPEMRAFASRGLLTRGQEPRNDLRGSLPLACFLLDLLPASPREAVVLGPAIVIGNTPRRRDIALLLQLEQRWVDRSVVHCQPVAAGLLDSARDPV